MKDTDIIAAIAPDAVSLMDKAIAEIKRLRQENATLTAERDALFVLTDRLTAEHDALRAECDEARLQTRRILNEIDCRIEHGAESNGHLEAIRNLFKEATDGK